MGFKIEGLDKLQRDLEQASKAFAALDGHLTTLQFNPLDHASVEAAIGQVEQAIDEKTAPYLGNQIIIDLAAQMKQKYQNEILERATTARLENDSPSVNKSATPAELRQIEDALTDLRSANSQTFDRPIKKLSRLLHSDALAPFTDRLTAGTDIDGFLKNGHATQGGMIGSAILTWPEKHQDELGLVIALIDRFAANLSDAINFSHTFYTNGRNITANLRSMVGQMIVPFTRDYLNFVKNERGVGMSDTKAPEAATYNQQFNFHHSSIGAVQTGSHAIANVTLQNNSHEAAELLKALDVAAAALSQMDAIPGHNKDEVLELVEDGKAELAKPKPNVTKLTSYLGMIGGALGAVANMKPAYETLKASAALVGILLP